jgi:transposase-like protein
MLNTGQRLRAAKVVFEATLPGATDSAVARKHQVHRKTVANWRRAAESGEDPKLSSLVTELRNRAEVQWFKELGKAVAGGIEFLQRAYERADPTSPEAIRAVTDSLAALVEAEATYRAVNARIARQAGEARTEARPTAAGRTATIQ